MQNFEKYLESKGLLDSWEKTKTGLKLEEDYLDEKLSQHRLELEPLYNTRNSIKQLNSTNLAAILTDEGYIKSESWPYNQRTSRDSPKPKLGFLLNLSPWLRMLLQPKPGRAWLTIDYKTQEVLVAACMSLDDQMLDDYLTDIFLGAAIKTGFVPPGATKKTHPEIRDKFKPIIHGVNFGMQDESLSYRFADLYSALGDSRDIRECLRIAKKFLRDHEKVYYKYYEYVRKLIKECKSSGYHRCLNGWVYFADSKTRETQLRNIPAQSGGAAITQLAHDICVAQGIDVISLHDSLSLECHQDDAHTLAKRVSKIMVDAAAQVLGYDYMATETKIYTSNYNYYDPRGEQIYRFVLTKLGLDVPAEFKKPKEIANIHLM